MTISIIKSLCVALVLLTLATGTILSIIHYIKLATARSVTLRHFLVALGCVLMVALGVVLLGDCIYPFERELEPILIAECELAADCRNRFQYNSQISIVLLRIHIYR